MLTGYTVISLNTTLTGHAQFYHLWSWNSRDVKIT